MRVDDRTDVFCAGVAYFDVVFVKDWVELVGFCKVFVDEFEEGFAHICCDIFVVWRVEPDNFSFSGATVFGIIGGFIEWQVNVFVATCFQGFFINGFCLVENGFIWRVTA